MGTLKVYNLATFLVVNYQNYLFFSPNYKRKADFKYSFSMPLPMGRRAESLVSEQNFRFPVQAADRAVYFIPCYYKLLATA